MRLDHAEGEWAARLQAEVGHPGELGPVHLRVVALQVGNGFEDPLALLCEHSRNADQLLRGRKRAGDGLAVGRLVDGRPGGGEAEGAAADRIGHDLAHALDVLGRGLLLVDAALAHRPEANGAVSHHAAHVDAFRQCLHGVEVFAVGLPAPGEALHDARRRDVLDRLHQAREVLAVFGPAGGEADAAVAHHHRRHPVPARRGDDRVPEDLCVEVGVDVDEARRDQTAVGVDRPVRRPVDAADGGDAVARDRHVGPRGLAAAAVDERSIPDHEVVGHVVSPCGRALPSDREHSTRGAPGNQRLRGVGAGRAGRVTIAPCPAFPS